MVLIVETHLWPKTQKLKDKKTILQLFFYHFFLMDKSLNLSFSNSYLKLFIKVISWNMKFMHFPAAKKMDRKNIEQYILFISVPKELLLTLSILIIHLFVLFCLITMNLLMCLYDLKKKIELAKLSKLKIRDGKQNSLREVTFSSYCWKEINPMGFIIFVKNSIFYDFKIEV